MLKNDIRKYLIGGMVFNDLTLVSNDGVTALCKCVCGKTRFIGIYSLVYGVKTTCTCNRPVKLKSVKEKIPYHPLAREIFNGVIQRCYNPKSAGFKNYGARGISVCEEWKNSRLSFYNWGISNGWKTGLQIDRINNNGNYEPGNCRFVDAKANKMNRRNTIVVTFNDETKTLLEWCEILGLSYAKMNYRYHRHKGDTKKMFLVA